MKAITGRVVGAKGGENGYVDVILDHTGQKVRASYSNGMVQVGSKVTLMSDNMDNFYLLGTTHNGMDEVVNILLDLMQTLIDQNAELASMKTDDKADKAKWEHTKIGEINDIKSQIETLKSRLSKFKF
jgi:hypothetical protein